ncbi:MAG: hypothetical protein LBC86_05035 [Oscillospiraceae bacterium]|jgi:DNA repair exonuclease SbcCD ATPase subunit|nr:hypothetical protein [Oscillospiraceae bacterium]
MRLISLKIINFCGVQEFTFAPNGNNAEIIGDNDTGKTTIANAYYWLIFGTNAASTPGFSPKPNDELGNPMRKLTTSVEGVFVLPRGSVSFKREMEEKWTTKRGSPEAVFTGNEFTYFIDEAPVTKTEFDTRIKDLIGDEESMKCATQSGYFASCLDMKKRRAVLFSVADIGERSDYDIAKDHAELSEFATAAIKPDGVNHYTVDEVRAKYKPLLKKANDELAQIPQRVDEANRAIPADTPTSIEGVDVALNGMHSLKAEHEAELNRTSDENVLAARRKVEEHKTTIATTRTAYSERTATANSEYIKQRNTLDEQSAKCDFETNIAQSKIKKLNSEINELTANRDKLREEYNENRNSVYPGPTEWAGETSCPVCLRELTPEDIEQKKADFAEMVKGKVEEFNLAKSEKAADINKRGQDFNIQIEAKNNEIAEFEASIVSNTEEKERVVAEIAKIGEAAETPSFEQTEEYKRLADTLGHLQFELQTAETSGMTSKAPAKAALEKVKADIDELMQKKALYTSAEKQRQRIQELLQEEKQIAVECERYKQILFQCDEFVRVKVGLITESINDKFPTVRFKLFHEQINEGLREICDIMVHTKSGYQSYLSQAANEASRINADLEIAGVLGKHFDIDLPIFLDGSESITNPVPPADRQFIRLEVRKGIVPLKINVSTADEAVAV